MHRSSAVAEPKTEVASNMPLKLEKPDTPKPQRGLVLPKYGNTRPSDSARSGNRREFPVQATIQSVPVPRSIGGGGDNLAAHTVAWPCSRRIKA